jgi:hypothetical protein
MLPQYLYYGGRVPMIYLMSVGCGMQFAEKNGSCPGLDGWQRWGEHGGGRQFRGGLGGGGRRLGLWRASGSMVEREDEQCIIF